jgi:RNA polymerase II elongation factor ELL
MSVSSSSDSWTYSADLNLPSGFAAGLRSAFLVTRPVNVLFVAGTSPPANASEIRTHSRSSSQNNSSSSSSSSPLITQISRPKQQPASTTAGTTKTARPNGAVKSTEATNPLKRKAEQDRLSVPQPKTTGRANANLENKRRRAVSTSSGGSTGSASPPLSQSLLRQQLREKSQKFKQQYSKYRSLHDAMATHPDPPRASLDRLHQSHVRLQRMKKEIWDEDRRLREAL